jgi:hypothetical protein
MEILVILVASLILPILTILALLVFEYKMKDERKQKDQHIEILEKTVEIKSDTIKDLKSQL